jgi:hypothetical protein
MSKLIGVRYIGLKDEAEDTVTNSGAVWKQGEVHNFVEPIARQLLVHTDSFEEVKPDVSGMNFLSGKVGGKTFEVATYINLNAMGVDQLLHYAHVEFNKIINPSGKTEGELRSEVQTLMSMATLDEIRRDGEPEDAGRVKAFISVTQEELDALSSGELVIKLVPFVAEEVAGLVGEQTAPIDEAPKDKEPEVVAAGLGDAAKPTPEEIITMNKAQLLAVGTAHGITLNDAAPAVALRTQLVNALHPSV